jgi:hypothetical protein
MYVLVRGEHVDAASSKTVRDRTIDVVIEVEP